MLGHGAHLLYNRLWIRRRTATSQAWTFVLSLLSIQRHRNPLFCQKATLTWHCICSILSGGLPIYCDENAASAMKCGEMQQARLGLFVFLASPQWVQWALCRAASATGWLAPEPFQCSHVANKQGCNNEFDIFLSPDEKTATL